MKKKIVRLILLPFGLAQKLFDIAMDGARDLQNKIRFKGAIIDKGCVIDSQSKIDVNVHILSNCIINNSKISSYSYIGRNCIVQNTEIGKFCSIANDVFIGLGKHPVEHFSTATIFYKHNNTLNISLVEKDLDFEEYETIKIGSDVWIGARAIILDGVKIGHGAVVAANSAVTKDVPPYSIVGGVPAKVIKYRFNDDKIEKLLRSKWWNWEINKIKTQIKFLNNL